MQFGRILTAMVTPFTDDLKVDYDGVARLAEYLINNGSDGLVVSGTTGESATLTIEERFNLWKLVKEVVGDRGCVIAGAGNNCTAESIELTRIAETAGVDGIMLVVPYYNNPPQEGLYQHFKAVSATTELPIVLYNVPGRTVRNMEAATTLRLAEIKNIAAVKEASKNLEQVAAIIANKPDDFLVYSGDDAITLPMLSMGAYGVISVASHVAGNKLKAMVNAYLSGDFNKASALHLELTPIFRDMFITTNPIPVKTALNLMGIKVGGMRLPLVEATPAETEKIKTCLKNSGII